MRRFTIKTEGFRQARQRLDSVGDRGRNLRPAFEVSITYWQQSERRRFASARGWRKVSRNWTEAKRRRGLDARAMRASGQLERALVNVDRSKGVVARATEDALFVGVQPGASDIHYARYQAKQGRQPVRFDTQARKDTSETVMEYVSSGWARGL
jgi:hypothetical protein